MSQTSSFNDIWGYSHNDGTEYALIGDDVGNWVWTDYTDQATCEMYAGEWHGSIEGSEGNNSFDDHVFDTSTKLSCVSPIALP